MSDKPELIWERGAVNDLARLRDFIESKNPKAALNAAKRIIEAANLLLDQPYLGHPIEDMPEFLKLNVPFGKRGYVMKYRIDGEKIIILRIWHGKETDRV